MKKRVESYGVLNVIGKCENQNTVTIAVFFFTSGSATMTLPTRI